METGSLYNPLDQVHVPSAVKHSSFRYRRMIAMHLLVITLLLSFNVAQSSILDFDVPACIDPSGFNQCYADVARELKDCSDNKCATATCESGPLCLDGRDDNCQIACGCMASTRAINCALSHCWNLASLSRLSGAMSTDSKAGLLVRVSVSRCECVYFLPLERRVSALLSASGQCTGRMLLQHRSDLQLMVDLRTREPSVRSEGTRIRARSSGTETGMHCMHLLGRAVIVRGIRACDTRD
jgi:hypothetical protein